MTWGHLAGELVVVPRPVQDRPHSGRAWNLHPLGLRRPGRWERPPAVECRLGANLRCQLTCSARGLRKGLDCPECWAGKEHHLAPGRRVLLDTERRRPYDGHWLTALLGPLRLSDQLLSGGGPVASNTRSAPSSPVAGAVVQPHPPVGPAPSPSPTIPAGSGPYVLTKMSR
jgi:hypothetical protein